MTTAERFLGIDRVMCKAPAYPVTVAALRASFAERIPADRALWRSDGNVERGVLTELHDDDVLDPPGWIDIYTARRDCVEATDAGAALFAEAFTPGTQFRTRRGLARVTTDISSHFSNGNHRVVACDPNLVSGGKPFERKLSAGAFRVRVARARFDDASVGLRNTFAALVADQTDLRALNWVPATAAGDTDAWRYPVDYGIGSFMTERLATGLAKGGSRYDRIMRKLNQRNERVQFENSSGSVLAAFDAGMGDGRYASFWGLDAAGKALALITDLAVLTG